MSAALNLLSPSPAVRCYDACVEQMETHARTFDPTEHRADPDGYFVRACFRHGIEDGIRFRLPLDGLLIDSSAACYAPEIDRLPAPITVLDFRQESDSICESVMVVIGSGVELWDGSRTGGHMVFLAHRIAPGMMRVAVPDFAHDRAAAWKFESTVVRFGSDFRVTLSEEGGQIYQRVEGCSTQKRAPTEEDEEEFVNEWGRPLLVLAQFLTVMQCENVRTVQLPENKAIAKARQRRGKAALSTWYTLDVCLPSSKATTVQAGGSHASPRFHLRRGHVRRLSVTKTTWVRSCAVGNPELGTIVKDYRAAAVGKGC